MVLIYGDLRLRRKFQEATGLYAVGGYKRSLKTMQAYGTLLTK